MDVVSTFALFVTMLALAALPSASVLLVVARSVSNGIANGIAAAIGVLLGDLIFLGLVLFGLTSLAETMGSAFSILRYAGGAYLIWFGISILRSSSPVPERLPNRQQSSLASSLLAGLALTLGDLKAILFYGSLMPLFVIPGVASISDIIVVVLVTVITVGGVKSYYACVATKLVAKLHKTGGIRRVQPVAGAALVGTGLYVIAKN